MARRVKMKRFFKEFFCNSCWCLTIPIALVATGVGFYWLGWQSLWVGLGTILFLRTGIASVSLTELPELPPRKYVYAPPHVVPSYATNRGQHRPFEIDSPQADPEKTSPKIDSPQAETNDKVLEIGV
jgi:hypothetical protein